MKDLTLEQLSSIFDASNAIAFDMHKAVPFRSSDGRRYLVDDICIQGVSFVHNNYTDKEDGIYLKDPCRGSYSTPPSCHHTPLEFL